MGGREDERAQLRSFGIELIEPERSSGRRTSNLRFSLKCQWWPVRGGRAGRVESQGAALSRP